MSLTRKRRREPGLEGDTCRKVLCRREPSQRQTLRVTPCDRYFCPHCPAQGLAAAAGKARSAEGRHTELPPVPSALS